MSSSVPSTPRLDPTNQPAYVWSRINPRTNRLICDKLGKAILKLRQEIDKETNRIRVQNRLNVNKTGVDHQIADMWASKIKAHVEMCYDEIYCHHWSLSGHTKTGAFVRACSAILGRHIDRLGSTEAHRARRAHLRQGGIRKSVEEVYKGSAGLLRKELEEQLDIEARELDLVASIGRAQKNIASAPQPKHSQSATVHQDRVLKPGDEMVIECGPLSAEETDTTAAAIELLRKLGFCDEQQQWPSKLFGPVLPDVLEQLKRAHQLLTTRGFVFVGDPLNPLGDGKSWVLKCEPPIESPNDSDPARLAHRCLQKAGINVATRPVLDGDTLLIPLWDSGKEKQSVAEFDDTDLSLRGLPPSRVNQSDNERLGEQMSEWNGELRRIAKAAQAKQRYREENARAAFPHFTLWKAIDDSTLTPLRRGELFGQACQRVAGQDGRFELIGELTGMSPHTAYDIYKLRPSRKRRSRQE